MMIELFRYLCCIKNNSIKISTQNIIQDENSPTQLITPTMIAKKQD